MYRKIGELEKSIREHIKSMKTKVLNALEIDYIEGWKDHEDGYYICNYNNKNGNSEPIEEKPFITDELVKQNNISMITVCNVLNVSYSF